MPFDTYTMIAIAVAIIAIISGLYIYYYRRDKKALAAVPVITAGSANTAQIQLHAYERLVVLSERIALPNVISRANQPGVSARDMQMLLNQTIREEFDYNLSQQIYVSPQSWEAVRNLKEQNILIINQIAATLPANANGLDLNKRILEFVMNHPKGSMHTLVQEALNFEAKQLLTGASS
jgi:hypothetical protein